MPYLDETGTKALWTKVKGIAGNKLTATSGDGAYTLGLQDKDGNALSSATLAAASTTAAGVMTKADKAKLDGIAEGATKDTVNNPTVTIKQGSVTKGSFTLNQSGAATITLDADTNTHYASSTVAGASATATANAAATNGNVYLNHIENGAVKSAHNIKGTGSVSVTSDANGAITVNATDTKYILPIASASTLGGVKIGKNLTIASDGTLSADAQQYSLPTASASMLGGVKVGDNLAISDDGVLSGAYDQVSAIGDGLAMAYPSTLKEASDNKKGYGTTRAAYVACYDDDGAATHSCWMPLYAYMIPYDETGSSLVEMISEMANLIRKKQDTLTAGDNITISGNTISAKDTTYSEATSSALGLVKIVASATKNSTAAITSGAMYTALAAKAALASPTFTGTPKAPTAAAGTNSTQIATTAFVSTAITNAKVGAATFQGTASAETDFNGTNYKKGWYWVVSTAFTFGGNTCEAGDMIFAVSDKGSAYAAADFNVVQANITAIPTSYIEALN